MAHSFGFSVPTFSPEQPFNFALASGEVALIVGPNGSGKSALLYDLYQRTGPTSSTYIPGHRTIVFNHGYDNLQIALSDIDAQFFANNQVFNRFKNQWSEEQFKSILKRVTNSQVTHTQRVLEAIRSDKQNAHLVDIQDSPIDVINRSFAVANLSIRIELTNDGIVATRGSYVYGLDRLSDGERAALYLVAAISVAKPNTVVLIDEPERHLHPSISAPLITTAVRSRNDVSFIFATHDLNLIETISTDKVIYVRGSNLISVTPEQRQFDLMIIEDVNSIASDLKRDILGARDRVLFVEGEATSLDRALYTAAYPDWKISPRGGADKVIEATNALRDNSNLHWIEVRGLIDADGRDAAEQASLAAKLITSIPFPSIENLFFLSEVVLQASKIASEVDRSDPAVKVRALEAMLPTLLASARDEIVARRSAWAASRSLSAMKLSVEDFRKGRVKGRQFRPAKILADCNAEADLILSSTTDLKGLEAVPIKNTGLPSAIAKAVGFPSLKLYKTSVLKHIEEKTPHGQIMLAAVVGRLPPLSAGTAAMQPTDKRGQP